MNHDEFGYDWTCPSCRTNNHEIEVLSDVPCKWQNHLKQYRQHHNLTQEALARRLNISTWTLNRWENGQNQSSKMTQEKLKQEGIHDDLGSVGGDSVGGW